MRISSRFLLAMLLLIAFSITQTPVRAGNATVTNCTDFTGAGTISDAVATANSGGGVITFACSGTIIFDNELTTAGVITINANGNTVIFDEVGDDNRFFYVASGVLTLDGLTMQNGNVNFGGAINNLVTLHIINSTFIGNSASDSGGVINNTGTMTITNSTFVDNSAVYYAGAILNLGTMTITNSTFTNNVAPSGGGAIYNLLSTAIASSQNTHYVGDATNNTCGGIAITDNGGNTRINSAGCPGSAPIIPPIIPPAPTTTSSAVTVLGCALDSTDGVEVANAPDNTYCRILMKNGGVVSYSGAIPRELIGLGVVLAVDVYRLQGGMSVNTFPDYARVCLAGSGRLFYMDGRNAPRVSVELASEQVDGLTCGWIPAPGTLILTN